MTQQDPPTFGLMTPPTQVTYDELLQVWLEADAVPRIAHAWLFDHLMPLGGDPLGPAFEGWTLLSALAAQTRRLRLGLLVTSNRFRPPALLAKIAATVDVVAGGRLDLGIGVGSRPSHPLARREYDAHGLPYVDAPTAVAALDESLTVLRRLWTEDEPFDHHGPLLRLTGAYCSPKPLQPHLPVVVGGRSTATLRVAASHADIWNYPGDDVEDATARSALLDRLCADVGRDPDRITRSLVVPVPRDHPAPAVRTVQRALEAGFRHVVLSPGAPYEPGLARWVADEVVDAVC